MEPFTVTSDALPVVLTVPPQHRTEVAAAAAWLGPQAPGIRAILPDHGAVLIRGVPMASIDDVDPIRDLFIQVPAEPSESFGSRHRVGANLWSTMTWPAERDLCPTNEQSYSLTFPGTVMQACVAPPATGGQTMLADTRRVAEMLPDDLVRRLRDHGWIMARTFRERIGIPWSEAFDARHTEEVEERCDYDAIGWSWRDGGELRTCRLRPTFVRHPVTGAECWFNQAGFLNEWGLHPVDREVYLEAFGSEGLPVNTYAGDGSPISEDQVHALEDAYAKVAIEVRWEPGDVLLIDNIVIAQGRRAYTGEQTMAVAFGEPVRLTDCEPSSAPKAVDPA
jgi:alpha-ketoglutarate-dependent taurine dioxygenase